MLFLIQFIHIKIEDENKKQNMNNFHSTSYGACTTKQYLNNNFFFKKHGYNKSKLYNNIP